MMVEIVADARGPVGIDELGIQAKRAKRILANVRKGMLAPEAKKAPPKFNTGQLGALVNLDKGQIDYRIKRTGTNLPAGSLNASGTRREMSLAEVQVWTREFRQAKLRPAGKDGLVIAVANFKGGVTKTTTAMTLAQGLSLRGHKVLIVDVDPQGSMTYLTGVLPDTEVDLADTVFMLCQGTEESVEYAIRKTYWSGLDLIPATSTLSSAEFVLPGRQVREKDFEFYNVLNYGLDSARQNYDVIIIDTPPALSYLTINAMMAADGIVMPLPPNALDFASSVSFWELFYDLTKNLDSRGKGKKKEYAFVDILPAKVDSVDSATSVVREWMAAAYGAKVMSMEIPKTTTAATASAELGTIYDMRPGTTGSRTMKRAIDAYELFVEAVEAQMVQAWAR